MKQGLSYLPRATQPRSCRAGWDVNLGAGSGGWGVRGGGWAGWGSSSGVPALTSHSALKELIY